MKKVLSMVMVLAMLACVFAVNVAAVDNYEPKTIELIANLDNTVSLPEGYVVYIGDTLVFPRGEVVFIGAYEVRDSGGKINDMAVGQLNDIMIEINGVRVGQSWSDYLPLKNSTVSNTDDYWFEDGANLEVAGKFEFFAYSAHDANWTEQYLIKPEVKLLTIDVVDPKTVDEIVLPPAASTTPDPVVSEEAPVASEEAPVASEEAPVASTEDTTSTADTASTADPTESKDEPKDDDTDVSPVASNNTLIYVIVAVVAVAVVAVVIVLVSKKKK